MSQPVYSCNFQFSLPDTFLLIWEIYKVKLVSDSQKGGAPVKNWEMMWCFSLVRLVSKRCVPVISWEIKWFLSHFYARRSFIRYQNHNPLSPWMPEQRHFRRVRIPRAIAWRDRVYPARLSVRTVQLEGNISARSWRYIPQQRQLSRRCAVSPINLE